ncbi:hypothetical protein ACWU37_21150 (plasmid) [Photobacterium damselae subsp. damselae]
MSKTVRYIALSIPLFLFAIIWAIYILNIGINIDFLSIDLWFFWLLIGAPLSLIIGTIYTLTQKKYWWLAAYWVLGGIPILGYWIAVLSV